VTSHEADALPRVRRGTIDRAAAAALAGLLDHDPADFARLPPMWHVCQLVDIPAQSDLALDGHPLNGVPAHPGHDLRRMFAGGRTTHRRPLEVGSEATRTSYVASTVEKAGRTGPLRFVTVRHVVSQHGEVAILEEHDIVYRPVMPGAALLTPTAGDGPAVHEDELTFVIDPVVLFRFSALTYNAHRIHYDREYAGSQGFGDLVVHGPLQTLLMAEYLAATGTDLLGRTLSYRLVAPAMGPQRLVVRRSTESDANVEVIAGDGTVIALGGVGDAFETSCQP
jgi:3-methylfumaryl-CoA hydratase